MRALLVCLFLVVAAPAFAGKLRLTFIYFHDADTTIMSGDLEDLEKVRRTIKSRALWFRTTDGKAYVVRDTPTLDQFEAVWTSTERLAKQLGELGGKQGLLGARQGTLGSKQGALGLKLSVLESKRARLEAKSDAASVEKRKSLERDVREVEAKMRLLDERMRKLEVPMRELSAQMDVLSKKHEAATNTAQSASEALIDRAISSGIAKPF
jgi:hypothetical protein